MVLRRPPLARLMGRKGLSLYARKPQYREHVLPIWNALPGDLKNPSPTQQWDRLIVGGASEVRHGHPYVYVEHGAGQTYLGQNTSGYSGGSGHSGCELFLCPNQAVADRWTAKYPDTPVAVVGSPKLDPWHAGQRPPPDDRTVAITFHWDCRIVPETRSAFDHYERSLHEIVSAYEEQGWTVIGHAHPRVRERLSRFWRRIAVEYAETSAEVLDRASVLVADNTSLMAEFMSCGRPVVALNAPWYRRDVHHGMRFWDWDVTYVDSPSEACQVNLSALEPPRSHPYAYNDGAATQRAVKAIEALIR